jgi:glutaredoxin
MKHVLRALLLLSIFLAALPIQAQYKWVGPDGRITYSDKPPPVSAKPAENSTSSVGGTAGSTNTLPYALNRTAQNYPVTLYTIKDCSSCTDGRQLLQKRGIPFVEKTVSSAADIEAMKKISSENSFPILTVGSQKLPGFLAESWDQALDLAGYPKTSALPGNYQNPAPSSLSGQNETKSAPIPAAAPAPRGAGVSVEPVPKPDNAPPGFRF